MCPFSPSKLNLSHSNMTIHHRSNIEKRIFLGGQFKDIKSRKLSTNIISDFYYSIPSLRPNVISFPKQHVIFAIKTTFCSPKQLTRLGFFPYFPVFYPLLNFSFITNRLRCLSKRQIQLFFLLLLTTRKYIHTQPSSA